MQDSKALRRVDRTVGRAACAVISWGRALQRLLPNTKTASDDAVKKVLLVELFEMGAAVMLSPSISYLESRDSSIEVHCLVTRTCLPVWQALQRIPADRIHVIESGSPITFLASAVKILLRLRRQRFDLILDYELFMRISAIFIGTLRARRRAGFYKYAFEGLGRGEFYETKCAYNQNAHISRNYLALTKAAFERKTDQPNFKDAISLEEIEIRPSYARTGESELARVLGGTAGSYIAVCAEVGKTLSVRNYPRVSFAEVIDGLLERYPKHRVVMIGTKGDRETSEAVLSHVSSRGRCVDLCGKTSFDELLKVISGAELLITNDNGPGHFATLTGTRTLALFSTDSPFVYGPLGDAVIAYSFYHCSPCISAYNHKASACTDNLCLQALPPAKIIDLAGSILDGKATFRTINGTMPYLF